MIEEVINNEEKMAIIVRNDYSKDGITFFTPPEYSQQLAFMKHPAGKEIDPHLHNKVKRSIFYTQEVLYIKKGKLRVDFYNKNKEYLESRILSAGDLVLLASGGHGMEVLEELEMFEIKQGPYAGEEDKTRFEKPDCKSWTTGEKL